MRVEPTTKSAREAKREREGQSRDIANVAKVENVVQAKENWEEKS